MLSPKNLQANLVDASSTSRKDSAKARIGHITDRAAPLGVVPGIERLEAELKGSLLRNLEIFEQSCVPVVDTGQIQNAAAGAAEEPCRRLFKSISVEPLRNAGCETARVWIPDKIGTVRVKGVVEASNIGGRDCHGESRLKCYDAVHLPAR